MLAYNDYIMDSLDKFEGSFNDRVMDHFEYDLGVPRSQYNEMFKEYLTREGFISDSLDEQIKMAGGKEAVFGSDKSSIFNFNGTQYGESVENYSFTGQDFEIEILVANPEVGGATNGAIWLACRDAAANNQYLHVGRRDGDIVTFTFYGSDLNVDLAGQIDWENINRFNFKYLSATNEKVIYLNGTEVGRNTNTGIPNIVDRPLLINQYANAYPEATYFGLKLWNNGQKDTGELIVEYRFDDVGSSYQQNYAVTDVSLFELDAPVESTAENLTLDFPLGFTTEIGKTYVLDYAIAGAQTRVDVKLGTTGQLIVNTGIADANEGIVTFIAESEETLLRFRPYTPGNIVQNAAIKDPNGVILENTLPGDWEEITQASGQTDWRGITYDISDANKWENVEDPADASVVPIPNGFRTTLLSQNNDRSISVISEVLGFVQEGHSYLFEGDIYNGATNATEFSYAFRYESDYSPVPQGESASVSKVLVKQTSYNKVMNLSQRYLGDTGSYVELTNSRITRILQYAEGAL